MLVEVPFNPIRYQSMQMRMQVPMLPILKGMMWQMIGSLLVTIMLLLSIAYLNFNHHPAALLMNPV